MQDPLYLYDTYLPIFLLQIANVNNCKTFVDFTHQIREKYEAEEPVNPDNPFAEDRFSTVADSYHAMAAYG